jgi:hypothetical protein
MKTMIRVYNISVRISSWKNCNAERPERQGIHQRRQRYWQANQEAFSAGLETHLQENDAG